MTNIEERWIVIPRWDGPDGFQHYKDRDPKWIKVYTRLLHDDAYLALSGHRRAVLHGLWLTYAMSGRCIRVDAKLIGRQVGLVVKMSDLESLNHAGFIHFAASKPLAERYQDASPDKEKENYKTLPASQGPQKTATSNGLQPIGELLAPAIQQAGKTHTHPTSDQDIDWTKP